MQVRVLELEQTLEAERMKLGELRKQHYMLAGAIGPQEEDHSRPSAAPRTAASRKPPLAQKPSVAPRQDHQVLGQGRVWESGGQGVGCRPWHSPKPHLGSWQPHRKDSLGTST